MTHHFILIDQDHFTTKKQLDADIKSLFATHDRKLLTSDRLKDEFVQNIKSSIQILEDSYPRCKPLRVDHAVWPTHQSINVFGVARMIINKCK
ncbi:hypothetical protein Oweho_3234 [Owenweeksia hongkongensis DSM 17368]|uniref:Uncharacterized protein n=1 Tax=Owenweeksia hongkongensis (strain DSM 17368 / CIP 108786 / JCM 12287 / NRRL B-23963 / UST20020801) TaxID=926562 RepID=G8R3U8_OWEHD|nr:hypothetical protein [Owenweeksia hongkongensis]AEV34185.1 hypothetical protein Oweho_3234 [Owenweeksia hongkongensis DSM 17368]